MPNEGLKERLRKVMLDHLTTLGYPNMDPEAIMKELKPMWIKIEEAGLIQPGMSFAGFVEQADSAYMLEQIKTMFGI